MNKKYFNKDALESCVLNSFGMRKYSPSEGKSMEEKIELLQKKVEILTKACEFYEDERNWDGLEICEDTCMSDDSSEDGYQHGGKAARQALKECRELG